MSDSPTIRKVQLNPSFSWLCAWQLMIPEAYKHVCAKNIISLEMSWKGIFARMRYKFMKFIKSVHHRKSIHTKSANDIPHFFTDVFKRRPFFTKDVILHLLCYLCVGKMIFNAKKKISNLDNIHYENPAEIVKCFKRIIRAYVQNK